MTIIVQGISIRPYETTPYENIKNYVISQCGESKIQEIRLLLAGEQLDDRKPSELLPVMKRHADSHTINDS